MDKMSVVRSLMHIGEKGGVSVDDVIDQLNHQYTSALLVIFTVLVSAKQYVGEPISCWCPAHFTDSHVEFTNSVCWVNNTYYVANLQFQTPVYTDPSKRLITYYQWIPMILLAQAACFVAPFLVWNILHSRSGVNLNAMLDAATSCERSNYLVIREKMLRYMVFQLDQFAARRPRHRICGCGESGSGGLGGRTGGGDRCASGCRHCPTWNYLTVSYLFTKLLYVTNVSAQLVALERFLDMRDGYNLFGIRTASRLLNGERWLNSSSFPLVTVCRVGVRSDAGEPLFYTVQCVLPVNLFSEKVFVLVWFWLVFVALATVISTLVWLRRLLFTAVQRKYVTTCLTSFQVPSDGRGRTLVSQEKSRVDHFVRRYLGADGMFIVWLTSKTCGKLLASELVAGVWTTYVRGKSEHLSTTAT